MVTSVLKPFLVAITACVYCNILLNYGYLLSFATRTFSVQSDLSVGIFVAAISVVTTLCSLFIGSLLVSVLFNGDAIERVPTVIALATAAIFSALQVLAYIPRLTAPGTEIYTLTELMVSIATAFIVMRVLALGWDAEGGARTGAINATALLIAVPLTYVTISLGAESYALSSSPLAYGLYYSGYGIIPIALLSVVVSQTRKSDLWATAGLVVTALPLSIFYLIGVLL